MIALEDIGRRGRGLGWAGLRRFAMEKLVRNRRVWPRRLAKCGVGGLAPAGSYSSQGVQARRQAVTSARLYVTALGLYEFHINGHRVGDHVLAPDWTDYRKRVRYQAYDVTSLLKQGDNAIAALLGNGWYCGHIGNGGFQFFGNHRHCWRSLKSPTPTAPPNASSPMKVGKRTTARSCPPILCWAKFTTPGRNLPDGTCQVSTTPVARGHLSQGAARKIEAQVMPPVRVLAEIKAQSARANLIRGHWTFDMGQNMVGVVRLKVHRAGGHENYHPPCRDAQSRWHDLYCQPSRRAIGRYLRLQGDRRRRPGSRGSPSTASAMSK